MRCGLQATGPAMRQVQLVRRPTKLSKVDDSRLVRSLPNEAKVHRFCFRRPARSWLGLPVGNFTEQLVGECFEARFQMPTNGAFGDVHTQRDLALRKTIDMIKNEGLARAIGNAIERSLDPAQFLARDGLHFRAWRIGGKAKRV